ncbi:MAG: choloylglycine hydrolase [Eubacteriales bacterium]|nr:choloylglycine hydrolase [Eubacteriales bacterium]
MCTALSYRTKDHYFGRTLDIECSYGENVCVTPRNYPFVFRKAGERKRHLAIIGMALVAGEYPLYYEAANEKGVAMAGLNFPGYADYKEEAEGKDNIAPFEFIPWILGQSENLAQARALCERINLVNLSFSEALPLAPLHWIISDRSGSITVESTKEGLAIYENVPGILTNNPPFPMQMFNLNKYRHLSAQTPENRFAPQLELPVHCLGLGGVGLPGDLSSESRFVRAVFAKMHSVTGDSEKESIGQFFHIMEMVVQPRGCSEAKPGEYEHTVYTSCINTDRGIYYYATYGNRQISAVDLHRTPLEGETLAVYELVREEKIAFQN